MVTTPEQLAASLVRRKRSELVQADARANEVRRRLEETIREEARVGRFRRAILIGSLAWGGFGEGSDVDLVVEGLAPEEVGSLYGRLVSALQVHVDLLRLEDLPPTFRDRVEREGVFLHGA